MSPAPITPIPADLRLALDTARDTIAVLDRIGVGVRGLTAHDGGRPIISIDPPTDPAGNPADLGGRALLSFETPIDHRVVWVAAFRGAVLTWTVVTPKPAHLIARIH